MRAIPARIPELRVLEVEVGVRAPVLNDEDPAGSRAGLGGKVQVELDERGWAGDADFGVDGGSGEGGGDGGDEG